MTGFRPKPPFPRLQRGHPLAEGLCAGWFLQGYTDSSGQGNNYLAVDNGGATKTASPYGDAYKFVAASSQDVRFGPVIADSDPFTIGTLVMSPGGGTGYVFSRGQDGYGSGWSANFLMSAFANGGHAEIVTTSGGAAGHTANIPNPFTVNQWYWVEIEWEPGVALRVYVNDEKVSETAVSATGLRSSTRGFNIGEWNAGSGGGYSNTSLAAFYVFKRTWRRGLATDPFAIFRQREPARRYYVPSAGTTVSAAGATGAEFASRRLRDGTAAVAFESALMRDSGEPAGFAAVQSGLVGAELGTGIESRADLPTAVTATLLAEADDRTPVSALLGVPGDTPAPAGWTGATAAALSADRAAAVEWLAKRTGWRAARTGFRAAIARSLSAPDQWSARIESNSELAAISSVATTAKSIVAAEASRVAAAQAGAPTEWGSLAVTVMIDAAVFVEWDRAVAAGFTPNPPLEIVASASPRRNLAGAPARTTLAGSAGTALGSSAAGPREG